MLGKLSFIRLDSADSLVTLRPSCSAPIVKSDRIDDASVHQKRLQQFQAELQRAQEEIARAEAEKVAAVAKLEQQRLGMQQFEMQQLEHNYTSLQHHHHKNRSSELWILI